jgi:hypothetical protein
VLLSAQNMENTQKFDPDYIFEDIKEIIGIDAPGQ